MLKSRWPFFAVVFVLLAIFISAEEEFVGSYRQCISQWIENGAKQQREEKPLNIAVGVESRAVCTVRLLDRHNGLFAALAAFIIAWFTYTLDRSSNRLWRTEERNFRTAQRAFVSLDGFSVELTLATDDASPVDYERMPERYRNHPELYITRLAILPRWKNSGSTPTRKMVIQVNWRGPPGPIPPEYNYRNPPEPFFVAPGATELSELIEMTAARTLVDWAMRPASAEPMFFIWGRADYEDVFGNPHFIEWCYRPRFSRPNPSERMSASFIQWGEYNRTDESQENG